MILTLPYQLGPNQRYNSTQNNANFLAILKVLNGGLDPTNFTLPLLFYAATNTQVIGAGVTGDTNPRVVLTTNNGIQFGPGNAVPDVELVRSASSTLQLNNAAGGAATFDMNQGSIINAAEDSRFIFGGASNIRTLPTSGTITGEYWHKGNWTQTGAITSNAARIHVFGTMTINSTWTVNTEASGGFGGAGAAGITISSPGGFGAGLGPGTGAPTSTVAQAGGAGAGHGGNGGSGGTSSGNQNVTPGGVNYGLGLLLAGSGGGGGNGSTTGNGGNGGPGGGSLYIEATGSITFTAAAAMTANGGAGVAGSVAVSGAGGGGSGGGIMIRSQSTITLTAGGSMTLTGGAGANAGAGGAAGGGGAGGIAEISGSSVTTGFTPTATGGAAGTGGTVGASAGGTGVVTINNFVQNVRSAP